jgi:hypothetical protein
MKTIDEITAELKLSPEQSLGVKKFVSEMIIELLESLRDENNQNFNETIESLKKVAA